MSSLGENLRREREMRGVSLEEISEATKISIRFLQAIENEEFSKLPGGIFARSFIRTYARYLGLDEESILADYQVSAQPRGEIDLPRLAANRPAPSRPGAKRTPLIAILIAVVMLAGGYALFRYSRRAAETPAATPNAAPTREPTPPTAAAAQPATATPETATPGAGTATAPGAEPTSPATGTTPGAIAPQPNAAAPGSTANPAGSPGMAAASSAAPAKPLETDTGLTLQVAATDKAWVAVDSDGKTVLQKTLNPNEVETLKAHESFDVTTGNAQGIVLTLNGVTLKPLGRRGEVRSVHLTREDLKGSAP